MVAVIHSSGSLRAALNYNEKKLQEGLASFLDAGYYLENPVQLSFQSKLSRLASRNALNRRVRVNTLHISMNFAPDEKLSAQKLREIAASYLCKIGFAKQPYLLYEHYDSGHPHVHLITTTIRADGSAIRLHNLGQNQSEKARKELEAEFGLVRAQGQKRAFFELKPADPAVAHYGKIQTKKAIADVLRSVLSEYKYCSLAELNAVLRQYNVTADRGAEDSRIYQNKGLVYRLLDQHGHKVGAPLKASDFYFKPTLKYLEGRFVAHEPERLKHRARLKNVVDLTLLNQRHSLESLRGSLEKQGVKMVLRTSENGQVYGITYVDLRTRCVFNGSVLGKTYSAKGILERCLNKDESPIRAKTVREEAYRQPPPPRKEPFYPEVGPVERANSRFDEGTDRLLFDLFSSQTGVEQIPWQLKKTRKKRKKNR